MNAFHFTKVDNYIDFIEYDTDKVCEHDEDEDRNCNHDYGRCQVVKHVKINSIEYDTTFAVTQCKDPFALYLFDRLIRKELDEDSFDYSTDRGYYGEYVNGFTAWFNLDEINSCKNSTEQLHYVLTQEYGHVLPEIAKIQEWKIIEVDVGDLIPTSNKLNKSLVSNYRNRNESFAVGIAPVNSA